MHTMQSFSKYIIIIFFLNLFLFKVLLDKLITYIVCWYTFFIRSCLFCELTTSQVVAISTSSDTGSQNTQDLIQSLVPTHYVCNGYISLSMKCYNCTSPMLIVLTFFNCHVQHLK